MGAALGSGPRRRRRWPGVRSTARSSGAVPGSAAGKPKPSACPADRVHRWRAGAPTSPTTADVLAVRTGHHHVPSSATRGATADASRRPDAHRAYMRSADAGTGGGSGGAKKRSTLPATPTAVPKGSACPAGSPPRTSRPCWPLAAATVPDRRRPPTSPSTTSWPRRSGPNTRRTSSPAATRATAGSTPAPTRPGGRTTGTPAIDCGRTAVAHAAHGRCRTCYWRRNKAAAGR